MRRIAFLFIVSVAVVFVLLVVSERAVTFTASADVPAEDCLACHADADEVGEENVVDAAHFAAGPHVEDNDVYCTSCHVGAEQHMEDPGPLGPARCNECHDDVIEEFNNSAHSTRRFKSGQPDCFSCHGEGHLILYSDDPASPMFQQNQPETCGGCHSGDILENYMKSIHGRRLAAGETDGPTCSTCHNGHSIYPADLKWNPDFKRELLFKCGRCHKEEFEVFKESIHGVAFLEEGVYESACCTCCHSSHEILPPTDPESTVYPTKIDQDCAACHADTKLIRRFNLPSTVVDTYEQSYHGRATERGDTQVANCASCHDHHAIYKAEDPRSSVNPKNLAATCGECHPSAGPNFIAGKIHVESEKQDNYWAWLVSNLYIWLIVIVIGAMVVHNLFDFWRKMVIRSRQQKSEPHVIRMSMLERFMHGTLATSFLLLCYTGFALVWPNEWWVAPLNMISNSEAFRSNLHRICGVILTVTAFHHLWFLFFHPRGKEQRRAFMPRLKDFRDLRHNIMFYLGRRAQRPEFGRFTYMEKAEYWALVWGTAVMVITGLVLWFQEIALMFIPLWLWEVFNVVHFYEAILAFLAIVVWHFYYIFINPDEAPMALTWLTGRMTYKELAKVHPEEFEKVMEAEKKARDRGEDPEPKRFGVN